MSFDCLAPVEITKTYDPTEWWMVPWREYRSGFFLSGMWPEHTWHSKVMITLGILQVIVSLVGMNRAWPRLVYQLFRTRSNDDDVMANVPTYVLEVTFDFLIWLWQFWLGVLFISAPSTAMSGLTMGATYFHSIPEFLIFILRVHALGCTCCLVHRKRLVFWGVTVLLSIMTTLQVLNDQPIIKAILTSPTAGISDIGNVITSILLARQNPSLRKQMWPFIAHVLVFFPHLFVVCTWSHESTALLLVVSASANFIYLALELRSAME
jgi:hypothetical protein